MSNPLKYTTSTPTGALRHATLGAGVANGEYDNTWRNGITPYTLTSYYLVYEPDSGGEVRVYAPADAAELIQLAQSKGSSETTEAGALKWFPLNGFYPSNKVLDNIVTDDLVLLLDSTTATSYPTSGIDWLDLSGEANDGTLINDPTFEDGVFNLNEGGSGSERIEIPKSSQLATNQYLTIEILFKLNTLPTVAYGDNSPILGARIGSDYMIFAYPESNNKSHLGVSYDDSRYQSQHESVFETEAGRWVQFTHVGIPYESGGYQRGKLMYYINGALDRDEFISGDNNGWGIPNPFYGGYDARWFKYSDISIAKIRMYNKQLTSGEISQNYHQGPIVTDDLVLAVDPSNLVSFESGTTTTYSLTGSLDGTLYNGIGYSSEYSGIFTLDGVDDGIIVPDDSTLDLSDFTLEAWIWWNQHKNYGSILCKGPGGSGQLFNYAFFFYSGNIVCGFGDGSSWTPVSISTPTINQWHHIVGTYDGSNLKFYLDGNLANTVAVSGTPYQNTTDLGLLHTPYPIDGKVGPLRIYNKALTADEVAQNYNANIKRYT